MKRFPVLILFSLFVNTHSAPFTASKVLNFKGHGVHFTEGPSTSTVLPLINIEPRGVGCPPSAAIPAININNTHEHYFEYAVLDNFASAPSCNWNQRFFLNTTFCKSDDCPVFLYIGGEGPLSVGTVGSGLFMHTLAKEFGAVVVSLEHRYYGKSWPTVDMSNNNLKKYLSSAQALADLANFQIWFGPDGNSNHFFQKYSLSNSKWVAFGGSYPGNLAAWVKVKYPQSFVGTVASSAPIHAVEDWPGYMEVVSDSLKHFGDVECFNAVQSSSNTVMNYVNNGNWKRLNELWNTCGSGLTEASKTNGDLATFLSNLQGYFQGLVQYNRDRRNSPTVKSTCTTLLKNPTETFNVFVNLTKNPIPGTCTEISTNDTYTALRNTTLTGGIQSAMRPWTFQTCNEFGYFQVVGKDPTLDAFSSMKDYINLKSFTDICNQVFEFDNASPRIHWSNTQYGIPDTISAVNVTFPSGSLDPWHVLGVTNDTHPWTPLDEGSTPSFVFADELAVEIPFTSHCQDMYSTDFGIPEIKWAHSVIQQRVAHYLSSYIKPPRPPPIPPPSPSPVAPATPTPSWTPSSSGKAPQHNQPNVFTENVVIAGLCGIMIGIMFAFAVSKCLKRDRKSRSINRRGPPHSLSNINNFATDYSVLGGDSVEDI
jgi:serine protease 16